MGVAYPPDRTRPPDVDAHTRPDVSKRATKLAEVRLSKGWSQQRLANQAGLDIQMVQDIERGVNTNPRFQELVRLAVALGVPVAEIVEKEWLEVVPRSGRYTPAGRAALSDPTPASGPGGQSDPE